MPKILIFLSILLPLLSQTLHQPPELSSSCSSQASVNKAALAASYASTSGRSKLFLRDSSTGYLVTVDFQPHLTSPVALEKTGDYAVMLSLYSSVTLLTEKCLGFESYSCAQFDCHKDPTPSQRIYPYFTATGNTAEAQVILDYNYWATKSAFVVSDCQSDTIPTYGKGAYGIVGLGFQNMGQSPFLNSTLFSIYLKQDPAEGGVLFFGFDLSKTQKIAPNATLIADENWNVNIVNENITFGEAVIQATHQHLIFDVNADAIGLPLVTYHKFLDILGKKFVNCDQAVEFPSCEYSGEVEDLPYLNITVNFGSGIQLQNITIPPEYYVKVDEKPNEPARIIFYLRGLGNDQHGLPFVTKNYGDYIVLDRHVMAYYYVMFDATKEMSPNIEIRLFLADHLDYTVLYIVLASIGLVVALSVLFVISVYCCSSSRYKTEVPKSRRESLFKDHEHEEEPRIRVPDHMSKSEDIGKEREKYMPPSPLRPESD